MQVGTGLNPKGIAVDATHVYWTNSGTKGATDGTVARAAKDGSNPQVLATGLDGPLIMTLDATHAYWTSVASGSVLRIPKAGGSPQSLAAGKGTESNINGWGLVIANGDVIWRDGEFIRRVPAAGGQATDLASGQAGARFLSRQDDDLYWGRDGTNGAQMMTGNLLTLPKEPPIAFTADVLQSRHGVASDAQYV